MTTEASAAGKQLGIKLVWGKEKTASSLLANVNQQRIKKKKHVHDSAITQTRLLSTVAEPTTETAAG